MEDRGRGAILIAVASIELDYDMMHFSILHSALPLLVSKPHERG
jgi:hypothetical protein